MIRNKRVLTRWLPAIAIGAALPVAAVTALAGGNHHTTAKTHLTMRPDSGSGGNNWALDDFTRVAKVTSLGSVASSSCTGLAAGTGCYAYNASLKDEGTFTAI